MKKETWLKRCWTNFEKELEAHPYKFMCYLAAVVVIAMSGLILKSGSTAIPKVKRLDAWVEKLDAKIGMVDARIDSLVADYKCSEYVPPHRHSGIGGPVQ